MSQLEQKSHQLLTYLSCVVVSRNPIFRFSLGLLSSFLKKVSTSEKKFVYLHRDMAVSLFV